MKKKKGNLLDLSRSDHVDSEIIVLIQMAKKQKNSFSPTSSALRSRWLCVSAPATINNPTVRP